MTDYEQLLDMAEKAGVTVVEKYPFKSERIKGLYGDGVIALSASLETEAERRCVLAEELGHHETSSGSIIDQNTTGNRKQERLARIWAYRQMFDLIDLVSAYKAGCSNSFEIAEFLNITEPFLIDAIELFKSRYGQYTRVENYLIYFEPLGVLEVSR